MAGARMRLAERANQIALMNANAFTKTSGAFDARQLDEWRQGASVQSQTDFVAFTLGTGVDQYGQDFLAVTSPDGPNFATVFDIKTESRLLNDAELELFAERVSIQGTSDFGAFGILFGVDEHFADFLIVQNSERNGPHFLLVASDDEGAAR